MRKNQKMQYNPTQYFFQQAENPSAENQQEIEAFVGKLLDLNQCMLCKENYNFTSHLPRILIHCGHTFCNSCLQKFHKNSRVRCPICLKLIRNIETLERLPVNHTIFAKMVEEVNKKVSDNEKINLQEALVNQFVSAQNIQPNQELQAQNNFNLLPIQLIKQILEQAPRVEQLNQQKLEPEIKRLLKSKNPEEEMMACEYHKDRINHFYCMVHKTVTCRVCTQVIHSKDNCAIVDFYDIEEIGIKNFLQEAIFINPFVNENDQNKNNNFMSDEDMFDSDASQN